MSVGFLSVLSRISECTAVLLGKYWERPEADLLHIVLKDTQKNYQCNNGMECRFLFLFVSLCCNSGLKGGGRILHGTKASYFTNECYLFSANMVYFYKFCRLFLPMTN